MLLVMVMVKGPAGDMGCLPPAQLLLLAVDAPAAFMRFRLSAVLLLAVRMGVIPGLTRDPNDRTRARGLPA